MSSKTKDQSHPLRNSRPTIAVLTGTLSSAFHEGILSGALDGAAEFDFNLLTFAGGSFNSPDHLSKTREKIFNYIDPGLLDGIIIPINALCRYLTEAETLTFLEQFGSIPIINIGRVFPGIPSLTPEYKKGGYQIVSHLIEVHGCKRLALIRGPVKHHSSNEWEAAYREALACHGLPFDEKLIVTTEVNYASGKQAANILLDERKLAFDAIVTVHDQQALGAIAVLKERGLRVPQNLAVTGSVGLDQGVFCSPSLSTLLEPNYEMGRQAIRMIAAQMKGAELPPESMFSTKPIFRSSCGCDPSLKLYTPTASPSPPGITDLVDQNSNFSEIIFSAIQAHPHSKNKTIAAREVELLIESFIQEFRNEKPGAFIEIVRKLLDSSMKEERILTWFETLSILRSRAYDFISDNQLRHFENIWHQVTLLKDEAEQKAIFFFKTENSRYANFFRELTCILNSALGLNGIKNVIFRELGITDCYIFSNKYPNPQAGCLYNILTIQNKNLIDGHELTRIFPGKQLLPQELPRYSDRYSMIILPLFHQKEHLGMMIVNQVPVQGSILENLRAQIGMALKNELQFRELREAEAKFSDIALSTSDWLWEVDTECRFTYCSGGIADVLGYTAEAVLGKSLFAFLCPTENQYRSLLQEHLIPRRESFQNLENWNFHQNGSKVGLLISGRPIIKDGQYAGYRGVFKDITEAKQQEQKIKFLAYYDTLTGLPNRTMFHDFLDNLLLQNQNTRKETAVVFLDLDRFKYVNDTLGHSSGDELLKAVTSRFQGSLRSHDFMARLGGDEFIIILPNIKKDDVTTVARRILKDIRSPFLINGQQFFVTASLGIAIFPSDGRDTQTLLKNADKAMYKAKEQGRNTFAFFDAQIESKNAKRIELENILYTALSNSQFELYYQPQVACQTGEIQGLEALIRLYHEQLGFISPLDLIPLAEEIGLIEPIGEWVFKTACQQLQTWQKEGLKDTKLAVNLSANQLKNPNLPQLFSRIMRKAAIDPRLIELEITENAVLEDEGITMETLKKLKKLGVSIALDDFGTGYSSLGCLKKFPIDTVKIDRTFVNDSPSSQNSAAIIKSIIIMAKSLNLNVVAEGVETIEQLHFIQSVGCDQVQGYLFCQPLPPQKLDAILSQKTVLPGRPKA